MHWANYTLNRTFSLEGKEAQNGGENLSQKLGAFSPKMGGGSCTPNFDSRFRGLEAIFSVVSLSMTLNNLEPPK